MNAQHSIKMNLILTLASSYNFKQLKPFFYTLFSTNFSGDVVLFSHLLSQETTKRIKAFGVKIIPFNPEYPYFDDAELAALVENPNQHLSPNSLRYLLYSAYIKKNGEKYANIIHSDIRDVVFQKQPFATNLKGLHCFLEDSSTNIIQNEFNKYWIEHGFGIDVLHQIGNNCISCSGFTLSSIQEFTVYLDLMLKYILEIPNVGGMDQGIHNYLIYTGQLPNLHVIKDDEGPVSTISSFKPESKIRLNARKEVLGVDERPVNIVHQYDRYFPLLWKHDKRGFFVKKWNLIKQFLLAIKKSRKIKKQHLSNLQSIIFDKMMRRYQWD